LLGIVIGLHVAILLVVLAAKTIVPQIMEIPLVVDLLQAPEVQKPPEAKPLPMAKPQPVKQPRTAYPQGPDTADRSHHQYRAGALGTGCRTPGKPSGAARAPGRSADQTGPFRCRLPEKPGPRLPAALQAHG
jgi:hypothetical protein